MNFSHKLIIWLVIVFGFLSCNTTKQAEKRIYNITEKHPELLKHDTVKIDTTFVITPEIDSVIFLPDTITGDTAVILTDRGRFAITRLPSRELKILYTPDTVLFNYREDLEIDKIIIEKPKNIWQTVFLYLILAYVAILFVKTLLQKLLK